MGKSKSRSGYLVGALFVLTALICCSPRLGSAATLVGLLLLSFMTILMNGKMVAANGPSLTLLIVAYLFIIVLYRLVGVSDAAWGRYAVYTYLELQVLLMLLIPQKLVNLKDQWVWWVMSAIIGLNILWNCVVLFVSPELSAVYTLVDQDIIRSMNVGGSDFYVMALLFFDVCFFVFLNAKKMMVRFATLFLSIVASVYIVWFSLKASVVVIWLFSFGFLYAIRKVRKIGKFFVVSGVLAVTAMLVISAFSDDIIKFVVDYSPSERISKRLVMLIDPNNMEANDNSYSGRVDRWNTSLYTWLEDAKSIVMGVGDHWGDMNSGIGQHSEFLDFLAKYGLIGGCLMLAILIKSFKFILSLFDKKYRIQLLVIIMVYIICGMTKRVFFDCVGVVFYLLLPLSAILVNDDQTYCPVKRKKTKIITK